MSKSKIAFICVHNSCRSQIAEAFGKVLAADVFESYSAGTETKPQINQDAVRLMKELYGIDMEKTQYSKLISAIPKPDIAISMGCNVSCPFIGRPFDENWGLDDPTGKSDDEFKAVMEQIRQNACHVFVECALHVDGRTVSVPLLNEKQLVARSTAEAAGKRCDPYRDAETDRVPQKEQKNSRRCLPVSGGQRRRMGRTAV